MLHEIEKKIRQMLLEKGDPQAVGETLWKQITKRNLDSASLEIIAAFYYYSYDFEKVILLAQRQIYQNEYIPWNYLLEALRKIPNSAKRRFVLEECIHYFSEPSHKIPFLYSRALDPYSKDIHHWRDFYQRRRDTEASQRKKNLIDQLGLFKYSEKPSTAEKKIIEKLEQIFPSDPEIKNIKRKVELKDLKGLQKKYLQSHTLNQYKEKKQSPEVQSLFNCIYVSCLEQLPQLNEPLRLDLVVMFLFFEAYDLALNLALELKPSWAQQWLILETCMLGEKYTLALKIAEELLTNELTIHDHLSTCTLYYYHAQCLWGLNQYQNAIKIMERLLQLQPDFRQGPKLLQEWKAAA